MKSVLFVCLGDICRSPAAEAVLRAKAASRKIDLVIESAGTGGWHRGDRADALDLIETGAEAFLDHIDESA
jgi:protein-tyrosine phosphatase